MKTYEGFIHLLKISSLKNSTEFKYIKAFLFKNFCKKVSKIPSLNTERLLLRPFEIKDAKRVQLLAGDEAIANGAINLPYPYIEGIAESWIVSHEIEFIKGSSLILAITLKEPALLIGSIGLYIYSKHQHAELGYWIGKDYWGNGYCSEAVAEIIKYAFEKLSLNKIYAHYLCRNQASGKVLLKNGFSKEGFFRQHVKYNNVFEDIECFSLLSMDYMKMK